MRDKTDIELKSIIEKAVAELHNRGYSVDIRGGHRLRPTVACTKVIKL